MEERLRFEEIYKVDGYGLIVKYSDGTYAKYTVDEMARMRPKRETIVEVEELRA